MGMVLEYLRHDEVWEKFCGTCGAIYEKIGEFDQWWYTDYGPMFDMQIEWEKYIRIALDSLVLRMRSSFDTYYSLREFYFFIRPRLDWIHCPYTKVLPTLTYFA
ncbi:hypothetical protein F5B21DRAFT_457790 [Xylaria acuta]|nr:hypothetical protein F5B21DRAFT_457790 [Xylaria acuta]